MCDVFDSKLFSFERKGLTGFQDFALYRKRLTGFL